MLDDARVEYEVVSHAEVFTAQEVAHAMRVTGYELAKVVVASILPASIPPERRNRRR